MKLKISLMPFQFQKEIVSIWLLAQKSKTNISSKTVRKESVLVSHLWHISLERDARIFENQYIDKVVGFGSFHLFFWCKVINALGLYLADIQQDWTALLRYFFVFLSH